MQKSSYIERGGRYIQTRSQEKSGSYKEGWVFFHHEIFIELIRRNSQSRWPHTICVHPIYKILYIINDQGFGHVLQAKIKVAGYF